MTLGSIQFSVQDSGYQKLVRRLEIRVGRQERAGRQVARQVLGEDETVEIEGVVFAAWKGGVGRIDSFRDLARTHQPQLLTDGRGNVWGKYIVEQVEEEATDHIANGVPLRQAFKLTLGLYGDDQ